MAEGIDRNTGWPKGWNSDPRMVTGEGALTHSFREIADDAGRHALSSEMDPVRGVREDLPPGMTLGDRRSSDKYGQRAS